jgi:biopolymer transport protein ExbD
VKINLLETEEDDARIEILPLIDVIFCILTFFIMASLTLTRQQAINLDLPKASTGVAQNRELKIVSIAPNGQLFMDKQPTDQTRLVESLKAYMKAQPNGLIVLNASPTVSYNQVIQVLDLLRSVGGQRVALATQPADRPALSEPQPTPFQSPGTFKICLGLRPIQAVARRAQPHLAQALSIRQIRGQHRPQWIPMCHRRLPPP